jgi:crotonobetaine/carnitine-CoA ligase
VTVRDLWDWAGQRLAPHMVPRFVRVTGSMPRTQTEKVAKYLRREAGVTADTADREAGGGH